MEQKQAVLFTASSGSHIRSFHLPYLEKFQSSGFEVHLACGAPVGDIPNVDKIIFLPFEKNMLSAKNFAAARLLRRELSSRDYSLIITHTSLAAFFTRLALWWRRSRPPLINMVHGYLFDDNTPTLKRHILSLAERICRRQTDLILTMNSWDYDFAVKKRLAHNIGAVPGVGVNFKKLDAAEKVSRAEFRAVQGLCDDDFVMIYAAEFSERKNQRMLIEALSKLPPRVKLVLAGRGECLESCKALCAELGLEKRVLMPGFVNNMPQWYSICDLAVSASRSEGLPFNVMEALHFGLPLVASRVKGHSDLIREGENGVLYDYDDIAGFCAAVTSLSVDEERLQKMSAAAKSSVCDYELPRVLPLVMEKYLAMLR